MNGQALMYMFLPPLSHYTYLLPPSIPLSLPLSLPSLPPSLPPLSTSISPSLSPSLPPSLSSTIYNYSYHTICQVPTANMTDITFLDIFTSSQTPVSYRTEFEPIDDFILE